MRVWLSVRIPCASRFIPQARSQDLSKGGGGGGHTVSNIIVMAFSPRNIVGCLLKKGLQRGGGGGVTGTPGHFSLFSRLRQLKLC